MPREIERGDRTRKDMHGILSGFFANKSQIWINILKLDKTHSKYKLQMVRQKGREEMKNKEI